MCEQCLRNVDPGSIGRQEMIDFIAKIKENDHVILRNILLRILAECKGYSINLSKGWHPYGFHIKSIQIPEPNVMVAITPMVQKGIRIRTRHYIDGYKKDSNDQLPNHKIIGQEDIQQIIHYLNTRALR